MNNKLRPIPLLFIFSFVLMLLCKSFLKQHHFDLEVLMKGNGLIFIVTVASALFLLKALKAATTAQFLQYTYISILLKLFVCGAFAFVYIFTHRSHINKRALFACMGLYLLYTFVERRIIMKYSKEKRNEDKASA